MGGKQLVLRKAPFDHFFRGGAIVVSKEVDTEVKICVPKVFFGYWITVVVFLPNSGRGELRQKAKSITFVKIPATLPTGGEVGQ